LPLTSAIKWIAQALSRGWCRWMGLVHCPGAALVALLVALPMALKAGVLFTHMWRPEKEVPSFEGSTSEQRPERLLSLFEVLSPNPHSPCLVSFFSAATARGSLSVSRQRRAQALTTYLTIREQSG